MTDLIRLEYGYDKLRRALIMRNLDAESTVVRNLVDAWRDIMRYESARAKFRHALGALA